MEPILNPERQCGHRVAGGAYAECRPSEYGRPVEDFIVDPPIPVSLDALGLTAVGVKLIETHGIWHLFDVVGQEYYPSPADFVEEVRRMGASRRLPGNLDFSKLTPASKLVLIHQKALILNYAQYPWPSPVPCPKDLFDHRQEHLDSMCAGLWWCDFQAAPGDLPVVDRPLKSGVRYYAYPRPSGVIPIYTHAIFLILPITNLTVITGGESTEANFRAALHSSLPVLLEDA